MAYSIFVTCSLLTVLSLYQQCNFNKCRTESAIFLPILFLPWVGESAKRDAETLTYIPLLLCIKGLPIVTPQQP
jgi:hypothetical protein